MAKIAEHHREQERKRDHGERRRIEFAVTRDTVRVYYVLEARCELVQAVVSGRLFFSLHSV